MYTWKSVSKGGHWLKWLFCNENKSHCSLGGQDELVGPVVKYHRWDDSMAWCIWKDNNLKVSRVSES